MEVNNPLIYYFVKLIFFFFKKITRRNFYRNANKNVTFFVIL